MREGDEIRFRIRLKAYDSRVLKICTLILKNEVKNIENVCQKNIFFKGPIRLPIRKRYYSLLRSPHIDKDSQEQFEIRRHKWIFEVSLPKKNYLVPFHNLSFPPGVEISIFFCEIR